MTTLGPSLDAGHERLRRLYEISKLLTRFDGVAKTLHDVVAVAAEALPVRSAVLLFAVDEHVHSYVWKTDDATTREIAGVLAHARSTHAYLAGRAPLVPSSVDMDEAPTSMLGLPHGAPAAPVAGREDHRFIVLPLVVERRRIFGAIQFEGATVLDETDLVFVNAVANQVAVALDRQVKVDEARASVERERAAAVDAERMQRFLAEMGAALSVSLDHKRTFAALAGCAVPSFADVCFIDEIAPSGEHTRVETRFADAQKTATGAALRLALVPPGGSEPPESFATYPLLIEDLSAKDASVARSRTRDVVLLRQLGVTSMIVVALTARGRAIGLLTLALAESGRRYARGDLSFAQEIARRASTAIESARLHQQTEDAVRQRQDVLAMVSHDLRTPLNTILLASSSLLAEPGGRTPPDRRKLEMISRATRRMVRMTNDLLDLSSIEAGRLSIAQQATDIGRLFEDLVEADEQGLASRSLHFVVRADADLVASCDRDRVLQVLNNLLSNAAKFTDPEGFIRLIAERHGNEIFFEVANSGRAIAKDVLPHLFERYLQAPSTAAQGRGLGLFIAKGIIEAHGGSIGVRSDDREGTAFFFTLPRAGGRVPEPLESGVR